MKIIKEFYKFKENELRVVLLILISAIITGILSLQSNLPVAKILYGMGSFLFLCSAIYTLGYFIKEFINQNSTQ